MRLGRLQAAADALCVTHGAVSQQISALEQWFGCPLFGREGRALRPNKIALELAAQLRPALEAIEKACRATERSAGEVVVTIACVPSVATQILIPALPALRSSIPTLFPHLVYAEGDSSSVPIDADIVISGFSGSYTGPGAASKLFEGCARPVCSPAYLKRFGPINSPQDLLRADFLHDGSEAGWTAWFAKCGLKSTVKPNGIVFEDYGLLSTAVTSGQGVALCPTALVSTQIQSRELVELSEIEVYEQRAYWLITPKEPSVIVRAVTAWVLESVGTRVGKFSAGEPFLIHD